MDPSKTAPPSAPVGSNTPALPRHPQCKSPHSLRSAPARHACLIYKSVCSISVDRWCLGHLAAQLSTSPWTKHWSPLDRIDSRVLSLELVARTPTPLVRPPHHKVPLDWYRQMTARLGVNAMWAVSLAVSISEIYPASRAVEPHRVRYCAPPIRSVHH